MILYADDIALIYKCNAYEQMQEYINEDLAALSRYFDENKSTINIDKTQYMIIKERCPPTMNIRYKGEEIQPKKCTNILEFFSITTCDGSPKSATSNENSHIRNI